MGLTRLITVPMLRAELAAVIVPICSIQPPMKAMP